MKSIKNKRLLQTITFRATALLLCLLTSTSGNWLQAQGEEKNAALKISVDMKDSVKKASALLTLNGSPVKEKSISFFVKRLFSLQPIGSASTDDQGLATVDIPATLPGDLNGNLDIIGKIDDDDAVGSLKGSTQIKWPVKVKEENTWGTRSLSASREKAPFMLIAASNTIIIVIWGTIIFVILQLFKIKKFSKLNINKPKNK